MGTDLAPVASAAPALFVPENGHRPSTFEILPMAIELAKHVHATEFVPAALRNSPERVTAAFLRGHELGLEPMYSLNAVYVVQGRVGLYAETLRALINRAGHEIWTEDASITSCTVAAVRRGTTRTLKVTYTIEDAKRAGLENKENWRKAPADMLMARASARMARWHFPEIMLGLPAVEELEDGFEFEPPADDDTGNAKPPKATRTRKAAKAAVRPAAAPAREVIDTTASDGPPAPPLPGEEVPPTSAPSSPNVLKRAQRIAMLADQLGIDRADVIYAVTGGRKTSGKQLTEDESTAVLVTLDALKAGRKEMRTSGVEPEIVDAEPSPAAEEPAEPAAASDEGLGEPHEWSGEQWRQQIEARGLKASKVLTRARELAAELNEAGQNVAVPLGIPELGKSGASLCSLLLGWMEEQAEGGES